LRRFTIAHGSFHDAPRETGASTAVSECREDGRMTGVRWPSWRAWAVATGEQVDVSIVADRVGLPVSTTVSQAVIASCRETAGLSGRSVLQILEGVLGATREAVAGLFEEGEMERVRQEALGVERVDFEASVGGRNERFFARIGRGAGGPFLTVFLDEGELRPASSDST